MTRKEDECSDEDLKNEEIRCKLLQHFKSQVDLSRNWNGLKITDIISWLQSLKDKALPQQCEQNHNNNTEPKFEVGDWVVYNNGNTYQVEEISDERYELINNFGDKLSVPMCWEKSLRLWTIQDAKDGDVLAWDDETIVIFKDLYNATTFHSYCHIEDGLFDVNKDEMPDWWKGKGFHPASEEQRDFFFQKMHDAGYTWDAENKKLIKDI